MPNIKEIRTAQKIWGSNNRHKFIWVACEKCDKKRWVLLVTGTPNSTFCNACAIRKPRKGRIVDCAYCGKNVYERPSEKRKYCSNECHNKAQIKGEMLSCKVCGKDYYRPPSQIRWRGSSFCSYKCAGIYYRISQKGEKSKSWQGGKSSIYRRLRNSAAFDDWRRAVFERDNYTCRDCGNRSAKGNPILLHPHHIKSFTEYPDLRFEVSNGITLCEDCHKRHTAWQRIRSKKVES